MAADSYSARLRLRLQATGGNPNTWGSLLNAAGLQLVEDAICGMANVTVANGAVTLSANNGAQDQARMAIVNLTGAPTAGQNLVIPSGITKLYLIVNGTGQTMTVTTLASAAATVAVATGENLYVYTDGTNVYAVGAALNGAASDADQLGGIAAADYPRLDAVNQFTAALAEKFANLTDGATITLNANLSNNFYVLLAGNRTLHITNPTDGQPIEIWVQQDGTGGRTLSWPSNVQFEAGGTGALSGTANALDRFQLTYNKTLDLYIARAGLSSAASGTIGLVFDRNEVGVDLFTRAGSPGSAVTVNVTVNPGVIIYAPDAGTPAFDTSSFPSGSTINLVNQGYILGKGGDGGRGGEAGGQGATATDSCSGGPGGNGGTALRAPGPDSATLNIANSSGHIWGGGGGGGGGGVTISGSPTTGNGGGGGGGAGGGNGGLPGQNGNVAGHDGSRGSPGSTGRLGAAGTGGAGAGAGGSGAGGTGGAGGDWGSGGASGGSGSSYGSGGGGSGGKAVDLNGGSVNFLSGSGGPNVRGLVS